MKNNSKRIAAAILAFCITAGAMPAIEHSTVFPTAYAAEAEDGGKVVLKDNMLYTEYSDHISLLYCEPAGEILIIPDMIDGKPVTEIDEFAFIEGEQKGVDVPALPESVKRVVIPESVERIGVYAFSCSVSRYGLEEVLLPETLKEIGSSAFSDNTRLNVYGLSPNTVLGSDAFYNTSYNVAARANYILKDNMLYTEYEDHISLAYCEPEGETLIIPDMIDGKPVTEIDEAAFSECMYHGYDMPGIPGSVKRIVIPESVESIGDGAFIGMADHSMIEEVLLPETLKEIGDYAFTGHTRLNVYGLSPNTVLGKDAFEGSRYNVQERSNYIQKNNMVYVEYEDHIALAYCEPEGEILIIPDMIDGKPVTEIVDYAFTENGSDKYDVPSLPSSVKKVVIPESVEHIGSYTFEGSVSDEDLLEVMLPETLKEIGEYAFFGNNKLNVYGLSPNTVLGKDAFSGTRYDVERRANLVERDDMIYGEYSDHVELLYCEPEGDTLYIPDMIDGKPVTEILGRNSALLDCVSSNIEIPSLPDSVKKLYIPEGVEVIGNDVFYCDSDKEGLYEVYLPSTLKEVGRSAFSRNRHLNVYGLPETAEVSYDTFEGTRYDVQERSNIIEKNGMKYKEYLDHITLYYCEPDGDTLYIPDMIEGKPVTAIWGFRYIDYSDYEDYYDYGRDIPALPDTVKKAYIPEGVEIIYGDSFFCPPDREGLYEVYLPSTLKEVTDWAFKGNKHLNVYGLPETAEIDFSAFGGTRYDISARANFIVKDGMYYWEYPDHIYLTYCEPDGDTLYIPDTIDGKPVTAVGIYDYENYYETFNEEYRFETPWLPDSVKKIYIPEGVEEVEGFGCPEGKDSIYEVHLPSTLKKVYGGSFINQKNLNVYGLPETAEIDSSAFEGTRFYNFDGLGNYSNIIEKNGMIYMEYTDHIKLYYCEPDGDTLNIPDMIDGKPVTEINGFNAEELSDFFYTDDGIVIPALPESVKEVIIPEGVKVIDGAFAGTKFEGQFTTPVSEVMYGDANLDGKITLADSLAILQFIANEDKYPLSEQAQKNADCFNPGDGITGNDAVAVMRYDTKIVSNLPIIEK